MPAHETAHQWWGDLLIWNSYREQWLVEGLSNYCVLLMIEQQDPAVFRSIMEQYRHDLLQSREGHELSEAGPVTLGARLDSSRFPRAYDMIAYGRGTWLFHMLRHMLLDADSMGKRRSKAPDPAANDRFFAVLRTLRERFEGREITTRDVQQAFEESLPEPLRYEGHKSLEWFFDNWVNGTTVPELKLSGVRVNGPNASGHIVQTSAPDDFVTSVPLYAELAMGNRVLIGRVYADGPDTTFRLAVPAGTRKIVLDPYETVLRR
jgi:aminopeptidase N